MNRKRTRKSKTSQPVTIRAAGFNSAAFFIWNHSSFQCEVQSAIEYASRPRCFVSFRADPQSLHAYFVREGMSEKPVRLETKDLGSGKLCTGPVL